MALLAGLLVKCIDEDDLRTAQELMKHELFGSRTLEGVVLYARRKTESALLERINVLHEQIAEHAEERDMSLAHQSAAARVASYEMPITAPVKIGS